MTEMEQELTFEQRLKIICLRVTGDVNKAQEAFDFIMGNTESVSAPEISDDPDRFTKSEPYTNLLKDEILSVPC